MGRLRSVGRPYDEGSVRVLDPVTLDEVPHGSHGEVVVAGDRVMRGYWRQPERTHEVLLPGALLRNAGLRFLSSDGHLRVERADTAFTRHYQAGQTFRAPMAHGDGNYFADEATLDRLEGDGLVAFRYATPSGDITAAANRNGSARSIAGVLSPNLRVLGLMPHPEDLVDPLMGGTDGLPLFVGMAEALAA